MYSAMFTIFFVCLFMQPVTVELTPVDAGVEDVNNLSDSFSLEPYDMRKNQSFEQLFRVEGSPEIFVRRAGSLHAVFRDPHYVETMGGAVALVPTGTIYCIGEVTQNVLDQLGVIANGKNVIEGESTPESKNEKWNPPPPAMSHSSMRTIRFLDDATYRRQRLASFVLELSIRR